MKLAFVLFHYFPYGGLERDMLAIALRCAERGHAVTIYTQQWDGERPAVIAVQEIAVSALTNNGKARAFVKKFQRAVKRDQVDMVVGFNKMPGLDIYYAADTCFAQKAFEERSWLYRLSARCRNYLALEKAVFDVASNTKILIISPQQIPSFKHYYQIADERMHLLSPGIRRDRVMPENYRAQRSTFRHQYDVVDDTYVLLMVGSDFQRKGVVRALHALAALVKKWPRSVQLWVAGQDSSATMLRLAQELGIGDKVIFFGARDDIPQLMWAADMFVHPAYSEAAGAVLLEAVVAGLPVVTTDVCGYAHYIEQAQMGRVITGEQADSELADVIEQLAQIDGEVWRQRAKQFVAQEDIFSMVDRAVQLIEAH